MDTREIAHEVGHPAELAPDAALELELAPGLDQSRLPGDVLEQHPAECPRGSASVASLAAAIPSPAAQSPSR
jgi:hypothetical protein